MTEIRSSGISGSSLGPGLFDTVRPYLGGRRGFAVLAALLLVAGLALNWGWLVAVGVAPLLLAFLPCAAMCALGLCTMGKGKKRKKKGKKQASSSEEDSPK